jgi:hypothetical protein
MSTPTRGKVKLKVEKDGKVIFEREGYLLYDSKLANNRRNRIGQKMNIV